jgi:hypothetical protein
VTDSRGEDLGHVDAGWLWQTDGSALLIVANSPRIYGYNGEPVDIIVQVGRQTTGKQLKDLETNQIIPLVDTGEGVRSFRTNLTEGQVRLYRLLPNQ